MTISIREWDDPITWNEFVASAPFPHFQQAWEWGELAPDLGGEAVRLAALRDEQMVAAAQVFVNSLSRTGKTHLYVPRGPTTRHASIEVLGPLLDRIRQLSIERDAVGIRLEPAAPAADAAWRGTLQALGFRATFPPNQPRSSWLLDISSDCETLLAAMKQKTRYNLRLAEKKGVEVVEAEDTDLDTFYELYRTTGERDQFFVQSKQVYADMFRLFRESGNFGMLFARYQGEIIAAVTLVRLGTTCWYLQGASSNHYRNLMAPYLLQWHGIQRAKHWGCTLYDFRAIPDLLREDQDMWGVYRFKEGFGGYHFTTLDTYSAAIHPTLFGLWQLYFRGRFDLTAWQRRRKGLSVRQFA